MAREAALFKDRSDAGRRLGDMLSAYAGREDVLILALPRGGVPVGYEAARALNVRFDIFLVRKLGVPGHEELAMGAIAAGGILDLNDDVIEALKVPEHAVEKAAKKEQEELERRERAYRGDRPMPDIEGRTVILIDDGLATGASMRAAVAALRLYNPTQIIIAVPTAPAETCSDFESEVDKVICAETPRPFRAVGAWYEDFSQTTDDEVREYLKKAAEVLPV